MRRLVVALLIAAPAALADAPAFFEEDWESGTDGWRMDEGIGEVECEAYNCLLLVSPPCCSTVLHADHALDAPIDGRLALDLRFLPESLSGNVDGNVILESDTGDEIVLHVTEGSNNGLSLLTTPAQHRTFAHYATAGDFVDIRVLIDGGTREAQAILRTPHGDLASRVLPLGSGDTFTRIRLYAVDWGGGSGHAYDDIRLAPTTECFRPLAQLSLDDVETDVAVFGLEASTRCAPIAHWSLTFGDGFRAEGSGHPPAQVEHEYLGGEGDAFEARLFVETESGESATDTLRFQLVDETQQKVTRSVLLRAGDHGKAERVWLWPVSTGAEDVTLTWTGVADLDLKFLGRGGVPIEHDACATDSLLGESCLVPAGAWSVLVDGTAVSTTWTLVYDY